MLIAGIMRGSPGLGQSCLLYTSYLLNDGEVKALEFLGAHYEKTIVLLNIGGIIDATVLKETAGINAVLLTGQLGNSGGRCV